MKKILSILAIMIAVVTLSSCSKPKVTDFKYKMSKGECYVFNDTIPYDGVLWSVDGKSYKMTVSCGVLKQIEYFDSKGKKFCFGSEETGLVFYNEKGEKITRDQARELYQDEYWHWKDLRREFEHIADSLTTY